MTDHPYAGALLALVTTIIAATQTMNPRVLGAIQQIQILDGNIVNVTDTK